MSLTVVNVRSFGGIAGAQKQGVVYVGRPSPLGNPFVIGRHGSREQVIEQYRRWLWTQLNCQSSPLHREVWAALRALQPGDRIGCWCCPDDCHADVIVRAWHWATWAGHITPAARVVEEFDLIGR